MEYFCKCCDYRTTHGSNYKKHLETNKHKAKMIVPFVCKHCVKQFKFKQSMYHHMKYTCKKNKDIAKNDLMDKVKNEVKEMRQWIKNERENREELQKWIEQVSEKLDQLKT